MPLISGIHTSSRRAWRLTLAGLFIAISSAAVITPRGSEAWTTTSPQIPVAVFKGVTSSSEKGYSLAVDTSGNTYTVGTFNAINVDFDPGTGTSVLVNAGGEDVFITKLDSSGDLVWAKGISSTSNEFGNSVAIDSSNNVYVTGVFGATVDFDPGAGVQNLTSAGNYDVFVLKLTSDGSFVWAKRFGNNQWDEARSIKVDTSGNVYLTGNFAGTVDFDPDAATTTNLTSAGSADIYVSKLNSAGAFQWAQNFGGTGNDQGYSVAVDSTGNVLTTGLFSGAVDFDPGTNSTSYTATSPGGEDAFITKLDASGQFVWAKAFLGAGLYTRSRAITVDANSNVYTTGLAYGTTDFDPSANTASLSAVGSSDIFVSKLNSAGEYVWARMFGGSFSDQGNSIAVDGSGNVHTIGALFGVADFDPGAGTAQIGSAGTPSIFVSKLNSSGDYVWARRFGGSTIEGNGITLDGSANVYTTGAFSNTADFDPSGCVVNIVADSYPDVFVSKINSQGNAPPTSSSPDIVAPTASATTAKFRNTGSATVQSTELGTAYLVNESINVTDKASITSAADTSWNQVTISDSCTNTSLSAAGLVDGTYKVYAVDSSDNVSSASTNTITIDTTGPVVSVATATVRNTSFVNVQSTETGTAYLVNSSINVTDKASITSAADTSWNQVTISTANTNTTLMASGLVDGTYKVYAVDALDNLSSPSVNTITVDSFVLTATWTSVPASPSASRTLSYGLSFNLSVSGIASTDFVNFMGTATGCVFTPSSSTGSSITVSVECTSDGTVVLRMNSGSVTSASGSGPASASTAFPVTIDTTAPTPSPTTTTTSSTTTPTVTTTVPPSTASTTPAPVTPTASAGAMTSEGTPTASTTTVATGQKTIATIVSTSTTIIASSTKGAVLTTTTLQTADTTPVSTVAPDEAKDGLSIIDVPKIGKGGAALLVAGKEVPVTITRENNNILISAGQFSARLSGQQSDGSIVSLDSDGNIRLKNGDVLKVMVNGFASESEVEVRLYSDPVLLGRENVDKQGTMLSAYRIPADVVTGAHRVVLLGKKYSGDSITFTAGIVIGAAKTTSWALRLLIALPLGGAVLVALFLPAILRRRRGKDDEASG